VAAETGSMTRDIIRRNVFLPRAFDRDLALEPESIATVRSASGHVSR
jgi:hypothetical protein